MDKNTACNVYRWFLEVCSTKLLQTSITLEGPGSVVQVDESFFRHKPKVFIEKLSSAMRYETETKKVMVVFKFDALYR